MIQASTIPTIAPALRLVGTTSGAETKQIELGLKLSTLIVNISIFLAFDQQCYSLKNAQGSLFICFTKYQLNSKSHQT